MRSVRVEDRLAAAELVSVVLSAKRGCCFDQPVFKYEDCLSLLRGSWSLLESGRCVRTACSSDGSTDFFLRAKSFIGRSYDVAGGDPWLRQCSGMSLSADA
jgi:hypothetical protein